MPLAPGVRIGSYEVTTLLGAGGMGEVYRARDSRLKREVALKVLPSDVAGDAERLARFQREAEVLASLNHPHIAQVYGLEQSAEGTALVMELVEGDDLSQRVARGAMPLDEALPIARQIAEALEAAHDAGIIHRDLKPANIKVRPDGTVKVLDFGLAKAVEQASGSRLQASGEAVNSPTITTPAQTTRGVILGTAAYMAPEQAKGQTVDRRADVWAFGAVLFEMLAGTRAFAGDDVGETLASVIKGTVEWPALPAGVPPRVRRLIEECLKRDRTARIVNMGVVRYALADVGIDAPVARTAASPGSTPSVRPVRRWLVAAACLALGVLAGGSLVAWWWPAAEAGGARPAIRFVVSTPELPADLTNLDRNVAISPDGTHVAYISGRQRLVVRAMSDLEPALTLSEPGGPRNPFFSPDGRWVGFYRNDQRDLARVAVSGGEAISIGRLEQVPRGAVWTPDGSIILGVNLRDVGLRRMSASGGAPELLTRPDPSQGEVNHAWPALLPNGAVLFTVWTGEPATSSIAALDLKTRARKTILKGGTSAQYIPSGHLVYASASTLHAIRFDVDRLEVTGTPVPMVERLHTSAGTGAGSFSVAGEGTLVYLPTDRASLQTASLAWVDRRGREEVIPAPSHRYFFMPRLSPDGTRIAIDTRDPDNTDIWMWDLGRRVLTRLTTDAAADWYPVWTPDGRRLAYAATRAGGNVPHWHTVDRPASAEALTTATNVGFPYSFTPDGRTLITGAPGGFSTLDVSTPERPPAPLFKATSTVRNAELSRDGEWLAYESDETGRLEVFVRPFPDVDAGKWQVSTNGGAQPVWSRDGTELFFIDANRMLSAARVRTGSTFEVPAITPVVDMSPYFGNDRQGRPYDVSLDGQRFLVIKDTTDPAKRPQAIAVLNFADELRRLVP